MTHSIWSISLKWHSKNSKKKCNKNQQHHRFKFTDFTIHISSSVALYLYLILTLHHFSSIYTGLNLWNLYVWPKWMKKKHIFLRFSSWLLTEWLLPPSVFCFIIIIHLYQFFLHFTSLRGGGMLCTNMQPQKNMHTRQYINIQITQKSQLRVEE